VFWNPPAPYKWENIDPVLPEDEKGKTLRIYESHVGMAQEAGKVSSYREYVEHILPRIKEAGYNAI
jgi:1,4-alpha-glucan branching enzyme